MSLYARISSLGSIETPYFLLKTHMFIQIKSVVFLNPDQEGVTKIAVCDVDLTLQNINQDYLSSKENNLFSLKNLKMLIL